MAEDAEIFAAAVRYAVERRDEDAALTIRQLPSGDRLAALETQGRTGTLAISRTARPSSSRRLLARVYQRDGWRCRYCGRRVVVPGILEIMGTLFPSDFPFPPGHNMPTNGTHPAAIRMYPNVDHVLPGSQGGSWTADDNLVTACTICNQKKGDRLGWTCGALSVDHWDGLAHYYRALIERIAMRRYHADWLSAIEAAEREQRL